MADADFLLWLNFRDCCFGCVELASPRGWFFPVGSPGDGYSWCCGYHSGCDFGWGREHPQLCDFHCFSYGLFACGSPRCPRSWAQTTANGVPKVSIFYASAGALILLVANYTLPQTVLVPLIATIGTIALVMYLVIAVSQVILRKRAIAEGKALIVEFPLFPALSYFTIAAIVSFLVLMAVVPGHQTELLVSSVLTLALIGLGVILQRRDQAKPA